MVKLKMQIKLFKMPVNLVSQFKLCYIDWGLPNEEHCDDVHIEWVVFVAGYEHKEVPNEARNKGHQSVDCHEYGLG